MAEFQSNNRAFVLNLAFEINVPIKLVMKKR